MTLNLPGQAEAEKFGYSLLNFGGDRRSATYVKSDIWLTVHDDSTANLSSLIGMVQLRIGGFKFPNPHFAVFEKQIQSILDKCTR